MTTLAEAKTKADENPEISVAIVGDTVIYRVLAVWLALGGVRDLIADADIDAGWEEASLDEEALCRMAMMAMVSPETFTDALERLRALNLIFPDGTIATSASMLLGAEYERHTTTPVAPEQRT
jgi:hypothetical protein